MNYDSRTVNEHQLHRYVDGELSDAEAEAVARLVADDPALQARVEQYREINRRLADIYGDAPGAPVPARLLLAASGKESQLPITRIAASLIWMGLGAILAFALQNRFNDEDFLRPLPVEAAFAHTVYVPEVRHPVEVNADEQQHLNAWLSKRLDRTIAAPDLREADYDLIGGRLLPDGHRAAAQFMYQDESGERITLFIRHALEKRETSFMHAENNQLGIVYWVDDGLAFAITAATSRDRLNRAAAIVYREVNP